MQRQPSILQITKDLIDNFTRQLPSSMPEGWTTGVLVSLVANKHQLTSFGPYYNYSIELPSEGESSIDRSSAGSLNSDESFQVFFPTVKEMIEYYLDSKQCELSKDLRLAEQKHLTDVLVENSSRKDVDILLEERKLKPNSIKECIISDSVYAKYRFHGNREAVKAYKIILEISKTPYFLIKKRNQPMPPTIILRNIPEAITAEELRSKITEIANIQMINMCKPFRLRQTFNTFITFSSIKDCEVVCYHLNKKNTFFKRQQTKCNIHPHSRRQAYDTNFSQYFRIDDCKETFCRLVPHWRSIQNRDRVPKEDEQEGQIHVEDVKTVKKTHKKKHY